MDKLNLNNYKIHEKFSGIVGVKQLSILMSKNGDPYVSGMLINGNDRWSFKVWNKELTKWCQKLIESMSMGFIPFVANVRGTVDEFNGNPSYVVTSIDVVDNERYEDYMPSLNITEGYNALFKFIEDNVYTNYREVINAVLCMSASKAYVGTQSVDDNTNIASYLIGAWAASGNHDALRGGLVHHTQKMLNIAKAMLDNNPGLMEKKDLIYTGIVFHDIGKTQEIFNGVYTRNSYVSHRTMGVEYMAMLKPKIVSLIGVDDYYRLLDIIVGHHDQFGTPATTVWGYLVHLIDMLDTWATMFEQDYISDSYAQNQNGEHVYKQLGKNLTF